MATLTEQTINGSPYHLTDYGELATHPPDQESELSGVFDTQ